MNLKDEGNNLSGMVAIAHPVILLQIHFSKGGHVPKDVSCKGLLHSILWIHSSTLFAAFNNFEEVELISCDEHFV